MPRTEGRESLWERLASFENLYQAATRARRGKRFKGATARFHQEWRATWSNCVTNF